MSCYFDQLPVEIFIKILKKVDTYSLINFCIAYPRFEEVACDWDLMKTCNLDRQFGLSHFAIVPFIQEHVNLKLITTLNINGLSWISGSVLRGFIKKLVNLEALFAVDTQLSLMEHDIVTYSNTKVNTLALTGDYYEDTQKGPLSTVKTLYLKLRGSYFYLENKRENFKRLFSNLEKLWIDSFESDSEEDQFFAIFLHESNSHRLTKLIYTTMSAAFRVFPQDFANIINYFPFGHYREPRSICYEYFDDLTTINSDESTYINFIMDGTLKQAWRDLEDFCPYGPNDGRKLVVNDINLGNIQFEEMCFHLESKSCTDKFQAAAKTILNCSQVKNIKKLSIKNCLLSEITPSCSENSSLKKKRISEVSSNDLNLSDLAYLEELEIYPCNNNGHLYSPGGYSQISNLTNLTHLTLIIPADLDCSFLIDVVKNCKSLISLRITSPMQNDILTFNINEAVKYASSLKDFRFEHDEIFINDLLESLSSIEPSSLERIHLQSKRIDEFLNRPLIKFVKKAPNLHFFNILIENASYKNTKSKEEYFKSQYRMPKYFRIDIMECGRYFDIPNIHYDEMMLSNTRVCVADYYKDISSF